MKVDATAPKMWRLVVRGHDNPRLMGVAIAIDPCQAVLRYEWSFTGALTKGRKKIKGVKHRGEKKPSGNAGYISARGPPRRT